MSDWYTVSFDFKADETPPTDPWALIQWLCQVKPIAYYNISLIKDDPTHEAKTMEAVWPRKTKI